MKGWMRMMSQTYRVQSIRDDGVRSKRNEELNGVLHENLKSWFVTGCV
jgi:hypothetical protein